MGETGNYVELMVAAQSANWSETKAFVKMDNVIVVGFEGSVIIIAVIMDQLQREVQKRYAIQKQAKH